ncbi:MAG: LPS assembly lipoprotein LptE [Akkermansiaceae bacterium]
MLKYLLLLLVTFLCASCTGYHLGGQRPSHLQAVKTLHVPLFANDTLQVRAGSHSTNATVDAIVRDGTYKIGSASNSDAMLVGRVKNISYKQARSSSRDSLRSEELLMEITLEWELCSLTNPGQILERGRSTGHTRFFAGGNLQVARTNAVADAAKRASESLVARIADGF